MSLKNFLGFEENDRFPSGSGFDPFGSIEGSTSNSFKGSGATKRSGNLAASITARVTRVLPNGNLEILGKREITVNNEKQYIALTGIIRPRDISSNNVVLSTYISDAKIVYTGTGVVNDRQNPGWLARVLDTVWPF
jgi:flagellar L-ring protein precursor FlgH